MSFREKSAWLCMLATLFVFAPYFAHVLQLSQRGELQFAPLAQLLTLCIIIQSVVLVIAHGAIAIMDKSAALLVDERDRAVELKSFKFAYYVLSIGLMGAVIIPLAWGINYGLAGIAQAALGCFVASELTKYLTQIIAYRWGC